MGSKRVWEEDERRIIVRLVEGGYHSEEGIGSYNLRIGSLYSILIASCQLSTETEKSYAIAVKITRRLATTGEKYVLVHHDGVCLQGGIIFAKWELKRRKLLLRGVD